MPLARISKTLGLTTAFNRALNSVKSNKPIKEVRAEDVESVDQLKQSVLSHLENAHKAASSHTSAKSLQSAMEKARDICNILGQKEMTTEDNEREDLPPKNSVGQSEDPLQTMALPRGWANDAPNDTDHLVVGKHAGKTGKLINKDPQD